MKVNSNILSLINIYNEFQRNDIEVNLSNHRNIIDNLIKLQHFLVESKIEIPQWKVSIDPLTTKAILHANSINYILNGTYFRSPVDNKEIKIIDIPSLYVLIRAQIENLLIIDYLYVTAKNDLESEFRHNCWLYSGLLARANKTPVSREIKDQQEKDKIQIQELREKIISSQFFHNLLNSEKRKNFLRFGSPRLFKSWTILARESNLNNALFNDLYPVLSNHAHSEALGAINLQNKKIGYHRNHGEGFMLLFLSQIILSLVTISFISMFNILKFEFNMVNSEIRLLIENLYSLGKTK